MSFWRQVFSEDQDHPSFSRVASGIAVVSSVAWASLIVWRTNQIPDLTGCVMFISILYGINKASDIINAFKGK